MFLQGGISDTWKYAVLGGLPALPFAVLEVWRSADTMTFEIFLLGSALSGYLIKRHGGNSTATGLRAALVGGSPALWVLVDLFRTLPAGPSPLWFRIVSTVLLLGLGVVIVVVLAVLGALAGRCGGWLAERRGHGGANASNDGPIR